MEHETQEQDVATAVAPVSLLRSQLESLLLVLDQPATITAMARAVVAEEAAVTATILEIAAEFNERGSGFDLRETEQGWRLYTRVAHAEVVERFLQEGAATKLTRAALETLAVIAYRQPVTRSQIAAIRGVNVDGVIKTLQLRGMVQIIETEENTGANYYATTPLFLEQLGIDSLNQLPDLAPLIPDVDSVEEPR